MTSIFDICLLLLLLEIEGLQFAVDDLQNGAFLECKRTLPDFRRLQSLQYPLNNDAGRNDVFYPIGIHTRKGSALLDGAGEQQSVGGEQGLGFQFKRGDFGKFHQWKLATCNYCGKGVEGPR